MSLEWLKELTSRINEAVKLTWMRRTNDIQNVLIQAYLLGLIDGLQIGDQVIETSKNLKGVVVFSVMADDLAVTWENHTTTEITINTRRMEHG